MTDVSTRANEDEMMDRREPRSEPEGTATVEAYEIEDGVVFYDAENPLAWVEASRTLALEEFV
ncbi:MULTISPECIES: DUF7331 family protein [Natronococcus]|uniref:Uncharacterized protein n=1 Tax=Natronococcus jeotgali DSM 18795 TaxID=1227498 RepID=L9WRN5_9EURY|nr:MULTISPECIES: hypothetical protein [Natronococcus]ELY52067.1 hypothetical protein C492_20106 [Natronococcus jeotgali DSM 18795]NKE37094.1 hypothetical protein [Natronococcus sp. JC468]